MTTMWTDHVPKSQKMTEFWNRCVVQFKPLYSSSPSLRSCSSQPLVIKFIMEHSHPSFSQTQDETQPFFKKQVFKSPLIGKQPTQSHVPTSPRRAPSAPSAPQSTSSSKKRNLEESVSDNIQLDRENRVNTLETEEDEESKSKRQRRDGSTSSPVYSKPFASSSPPFQSSSPQPPLDFKDIVPEAEVVPLTPLQGALVKYNQKLRNNPTWATEMEIDYEKECEREVGRLTTLRGGRTQGKRFGNRIRRERGARSDSHCYSPFPSQYWLFNSTNLFWLVVTFVGECLKQVSSIREIQSLAYIQLLSRLLPALFFSSDYVIPDPRVSAYVSTDYIVHPFYHNHVRVRSDRLSLVIFSTQHFKLFAHLWVDREAQQLYITLPDYLTILNTF